MVNVTYNSLYSNRQKSAFSQRDINALSSSLSNAINDSALGEQSGSVNTSNITKSINDKFQAQIDKQKDKTDKLTAQKDALSTLKTTSANVSAAIKNISSNNATSNFGNFSTSGVPSGVTIQPSAGAKIGTHSIAVASVASKQTIVIQNKDLAGHPKPFARGATVGNVISPLGFNAGVFQIYRDSTNSTTIAANPGISIAAGNTLADIAKTINDDAGVAAVLTAIVVSDPDTTPDGGERLVLQSINAGTAGNFYIGHAALTGGGAPSAINQLSVATANDDIQTIDIYTAGGNAFANPTVAFLADDETNTFQAGGWNIGNGIAEIGSLAGASLTTVANYINASQNVTGVQASIVHVTGGYVLRVQALPGSFLNYNPASLSTIFQSGLAATATQVRASAAMNTNISIDGIPYNAGGNLTISAPIADIASITVSAPVQTTTFSITQNVTALTSSITNVVNAINSAQQFIAQQQEDDAPLLSNNSLSSLQSLISSFVGSATNTMSLSTMGITWMDYTPSSSEKKEGNVPAKYLQINATTLQNILTSNFADVEGFFTGALVGGTATNATYSVASLSQVLAAQQFDLVVTRDNAALDPSGTPSKCSATANGIDLDVTYLGGNNLLISGKSGTAFAGLSMNYTYTAGGGSLTALANGTAAGQILGIQIYNGSALSFSTSLSSYLNQYGAVNQSITDLDTNVESSQRKTLKIIDTRDAKIARAKAQIQKIKIAKMIAQQMQKLFNRGKD